jgi:hypothetical protein
VGQVRIENVSVEEGGNAEAYWDDSDNDLTFDTRSLRYQPSYNEYRGSPSLVYEHSAVVAEFDDGTPLLRSNPTIIENSTREDLAGTISIPILLGEFSTNGVDSQNVDLRPISQSERTVMINTNSTTQIVLPTTVENESELAEGWNQTIPADVTNGSSDGEIRIQEIEGNYSLRLSAVTVGGSGEMEPAYIVPVGGTNVVAGESVGVEVRDRYNNPVAGVPVSIGGKALTTGDEGRVFTTISTDANATINNNTKSYENISFNVVQTNTQSGNNADSVRLYGTASTPGNSGKVIFDISSDTGVSIDAVAIETTGNLSSTGADSDSEFNIGGTISTNSSSVDGSFDYQFNNLTIEDGETEVEFDKLDTGIENVDPVTFESDADLIISLRFDDGSIKQLFFKADERMTGNNGQGRGPP